MTNGPTWERQRRIIDPSLEGGRVRDSFPAILAAAEAAADRVQEGEVDIEALASHATADVIFRTLFSLPIDEDLASETYDAFRAFQREQPIAIGAALIPWLPVRHKKPAREAARRLRDLIGQLVERRLWELDAGNAPDDLATRIMTTRDPETEVTFSAEEMVDQVAIFFLAGHETSAALLGWALWCLAAAQDWGEKVAEEAVSFVSAPSFAQLSQLTVTRNVLRETLRLYPPVPMMVRQAVRPETFRRRRVRKGSQIVVSPWHLGRHESIWDDPDEFDPARWETEVGRAASRDGYLPFSSGPRVCPGAAFAMTEAAVLVAILMARFRFEVTDVPVPVAHLTVRSRDGIRLKVVRR